VFACSAQEGRGPTTDASAADARSNDTLASDSGGAAQDAAPPCVFDATMCRVEGQLCNDCDPAEVNSSSCCSSVCEGDPFTGEARCK